MKRFLVVPAAVLLITVCLTGCDWYLLTREQVTDGFAVSFGAFFTIMMNYAGDTAEYQFDAVDQIFTYTGYDVSGYGYGYSSISGTADNEGTYLVFDVQLTGGEISTIQYLLTADQYYSILNLEPIILTIRANDFDYIPELTESDYP